MPEFSCNVDGGVKPRSQPEALLQAEGQCAWVVSALLMKKSVPAIFTTSADVGGHGLTHRCVFVKIKAGDFFKTQTPGFPFKPSSPAVLSSQAADHLPAFFHWCVSPNSRPSIYFTQVEPQLSSSSFLTGSSYGA